MGCFLENRGADNSQNHILRVHAVVVQRLLRLQNKSTIDEFYVLHRVDSVLLLQHFLDRHDDAADQCVWRERKLELLLLIHECLRFRTTNKLNRLQSEVVGDRFSCDDGGFFFDASDHHVAGIRVAELLNGVHLSLFIDHLAQIMIHRLQLRVTEEGVGLLVVP